TQHSGPNQNDGPLTFNSVGLTTPNIVTLSGDTILTVNDLVTINNAIGGPFSLTKTGAATLILGAANSYNGTTVSAGILRLSGAGTLGSTTGLLTVNGGTLDLNGTNQTVGALTGSGGIGIENTL